MFFACYYYGKIHLAVDAYGLPVTFEITGGDVHESQVAPLLIERLPHAEATVADKGYDSTSIRALIQSKGSKVVIPRKKNSTIGNAALDVYLYKLRHLWKICLQGLSIFGQWPLVLIS
jgi:transposase